jgi:hypothetical protein
MPYLYLCFGGVIGQVETGVLLRAAAEDMQTPPEQLMRAVE